MLSQKAPKIVKDKTILIVGCGGLGGYVFEHLVRIGAGKIIVVDDDCFCISNLNRQLVSNLDNIGLNKAKEAQKRAALINKSVKVVAVEERLDNSNIDNIARECHLVFDCCDNVETRLILEKYCQKKKIVLIHGAINDVCGQVATIFPKDNTISKLYSDYTAEKLPTLSYAPALVASLQVSEGIKVLLQEKHTLRGKVMLIDLLTNQVKIL